MSVIKAVPGKHTVTNKCTKAELKQTENTITTVIRVEKIKEMAVCFYPFTHSLWRLVGEGVECLPKLWGPPSLELRRPSSHKWCLPWASSVGSVLAQFTGEKTGSVDACSHSLHTNLRLFHNLCVLSAFHPCTYPTWRSHDCLPLLLHHRRGFLVLAGPRVGRMILVGNVKLLSGWRYRVLRDGAVLHVSREVPMAVHRHWSQPCGEVEGQWSSGRDVGDAGVWHHRSIAVGVAATTSFSFEVQRQGPPAPGLFDLSLHLEREEIIYSLKSLKINQFWYKL